MWRAERGSEDPGGGTLSEDGALGSKWRTENLAICPFSSLCSGAWEEQGLSESPTLPSAECSCLLCPPREEQGSNLAAFHSYSICCSASCRL